MSTDYRSELRKLAHDNWPVHQLLVLLDTGRIPADQWPDFALLTLVKHNNILQAEIMRHKMLHVEPLVIKKDNLNDA